jgi:tRNA (guanine26-N2/guanine27-N2)-dimethyltransferase
VKQLISVLTIPQELTSPFYFTPGKISSFFHCETPSLDNVASALLHAEHEVSRSHACPGSLKTSATRAQVHDIIRAWIKDHPVSLKKVADNSPTRTLLAKEGEFTANFTKHPRSVSAATDVKIVRYQQNPLPNWGPGKRPDKRKREDET